MAPAWNCRARLPGNFRNAPATAAIQQGLVCAVGLCATLIFNDGRAPIDLGCIAKRVVTTAFVNYLRDDLANAAGGADISTFKYHASGTGARG
jgi:hypothetical protein